MLFRSALVDDTVAWLDSDEAAEATARNAYWPKWDGAWWRATLLWELGRADRIPRRALLGLRASLDRNLKFFPVTAEELGTADPYLDVPCHCQLGTIGQILLDTGLDLPPWIATWMRRHRLPDGGYNCDEQAYVAPRPHSSIVSTLPFGELALRLDREVADGVARYLVDRGLNTSLSRGGDIDPRYWTPCFPRFYEYDTLRGLAFLARWGPVPADAVRAPIARLERFFAEGTPRRITEITSRRFGPEGWTRGPAASFPLLDHVLRPEVAKALLEERFRTAREGLRIAV